MGSTEESMAGRRLWTNGRIITLDSDDSVYREMLTRDERIEAVGDNLREQLGQAGGVEVIDLGGRTVVPGFADCHVHFTTTALGLVEPRYDRVGSLAQMQEKVREEVRRLPDGTFRGWAWDQSSYPEGRTPNKWDLDAVAPDLPVALMRVGGNVTVVNSKGWDLLGLPADLPGIERSASGEPTGLLRGDANLFAQIEVHSQLTDEDHAAAYAAFASHAARQGITTVHAVEGEAPTLRRGEVAHPNADVAYLLGQRPSLPLDVVIWDTQVVHTSGDVARVKESGLPRIGGDIFADGVLGIAWVPGGARAAISEPYLDGDRSLGHLLIEDGVLTDLLIQSLQLDLQIGVHAVGDRAIGQFLDCWEAALKEVPRVDARPRIEHGILPTDAQISRAADLGVVFSTQPAFEWQSGGPNGRYAQRLGPVRVRGTHPLRQLTRAGVVVVGGSDSPANVTDPLLGIHACVHHASEENRLSPIEALRVFTSNAACAAFEEKVKGSLEKGKQADFVVLAQDPTEQGIAIKDIQVVRTVHRGKDSFVL